jgi:hypothetical protein
MGTGLEGQDRRQGLPPPADQRLRLAEAEARCGGLPRRAGHPRGRDRTRLLL